MLQLGLILECQPHPTPQQGYGKKTADWPLFKSLLQEWPEPPNLWNEAIIEAECDSFYNLINSALDKSCPKIIPNIKHKLPWWNHTLNKTRKRVHRHHNYFQKDHLNTIGNNIKLPKDSTKDNVENLKQTAGKASSLALIPKNLQLFCRKLYQRK